VAARVGYEKDISVKRIEIRTLVKLKVAMSSVKGCPMFFILTFA
jgi:hypothetical protein